MEEIRILILKKTADATIHFSPIYRCLTSAGFGAQIHHNWQGNSIVIQKPNTWYSQDFSSVPAIGYLFSHRLLNRLLHNRIGMSVWPLSDILSDILKLLWEDFYYWQCTPTGATSSDKLNIIEYFVAQSWHWLFDKHLLLSQLSDTACHRLRGRRVNTKKAGSTSPPQAKIF